MDHNAKISNLFFAQGGVIIRAIEDRDDMRGYLLKLHLMTEALMEECIRIVLGEDNGSALLSADLNYKRKLQICAGLKTDIGAPLFSSDVIGSLKKLNGLRNDLAHSLNAGLTPENVESLFVGGMKQGRSDAIVNGDVPIKLRSFSAAIVVAMTGVTLPE